MLAKKGENGAIPLIKSEIIGHADVSTVLFDNTLNTTKKRERVQHHHCKESRMVMLTYVLFYRKKRKNK